MIEIEEFYIPDQPVNFGTYVQVVTETGRTLWLPNVLPINAKDIIVVVSQVSVRDGSITNHVIPNNSVLLFALKAIKTPKVGWTSLIKLLLRAGWHDVCEIMTSHHTDSEEAAALSKLPGFSGKIGAAIIKEVYKVEPTKAATVNLEAVNALIGLGYKAADAKQAVLRAQGVHGADADVSLLVTEGLKRA